MNSAWCTKNNDRIADAWFKAMSECHCQERAYSIFKHPFFHGQFTLFYKGE